jgi:endonuclease/exonuclease/phosphatase family metal-dependent hydrolase
MLCCGSALAFDPAEGDWSKSDASDLRVMTWNIADAICRTADKTDGFNSWHAQVLVIAALQPDILILQEAGDNTGNGTGSGVDSVDQLAAVIELFFNGGSDPFVGGPVTSFVKNYVPEYDLPFVFVSSVTDQFNRNVILSRYPFADLNGGGSATLSNFVVGPDLFQSGGNGGIRGFMFAQIDLPDAVYAGDVVIGNAHLKSGGSSSDGNQRRIAAQNTAYFIDHYYNGAGTATSDPNNRVFLPATGELLDANTPVIWGGDFNQQPGGQGPMEWMIRAETLGGTDGTDRDRSDSAYDMASNPLSGDTSTQGGSSKLDFICWQDSIAQARRSFIFRTVGANITPASLPFPVSIFPSNPQVISGLASDHRPVVVDFILPPASPPVAPTHRMSSRTAC